MGASFRIPGARPNPWYDRPALLLESTGEEIFGIDLEGRCISINRAEELIHLRELSAHLEGFRSVSVLVHAGSGMHSVVGPLHDFAARRDGGRGRQGRISASSS